jgi:hypothetical protein
MDRRFEAVDRRFEVVDRRFEAMLAELRHQRLMVSTLGLRVGFGIERLVKAAVEKEFAGASFPAAERLILEDTAGELYGVPGAMVEFDLYAHNGTAYLVEVKSHVKPGDVLMFHRKAGFAEARLGRPVLRLMLGPRRGAPRSGADAGARDPPPVLRNHGVSGLPRRGKERPPPAQATPARTLGREPRDPAWEPVEKRLASSQPPHLGQLSPTSPAGSRSTGKVRAAHAPTPRPPRATP